MKPTLMSKAIAALVIGAATLAPAYAQHGQHGGSTAVQYRPDVTFTLHTDIADGKLVFISDAGESKGKVNPTLRVPEGAVVQINLVNGDGATHDISVTDFKVKSNQLKDNGA